MSENKKNIPKRRFKKFQSDNAWNQLKLGELTNILSASRVHKDEWTTDGVPFFRSSDVVSAYKGAVNEKVFISQELYDELTKTSGRLEKDDILITGGGSIGIPYIVPDNKPLYSKDADLIWIKKSLKFDSRYLFTYFASNVFKSYIESISHVGTIAHYTIEQVKNTPIILPSFEEQKQIGGYFKQLDNLIIVHQRKLEKIKALKKAYLSEMFPGEGESKPKRRFAGFADEWKECKLSEVCDKFTDGDWIEAKDQSEYGIRLIQTGNVGVTEFHDKANNKKWISEDTFSNLNCEEIFPGDILISRLPEPAGRACIIPEIGDRMITAVDCTIIRLNTSYSSKYLVQYLSTQRYFNEVNTCLAGGTRQRISRSNLANFIIPFPTSIEEQNKIGEYFAHLDNLIALHLRKLEKLQNIKKAYLNEMFI